jgi:hypothetical protein
MWARLNRVVRELLVKLQGCSEALLVKLQGCSEAGTIWEQLEDFKRRFPEVSPSSLVVRGEILSTLSLESNTSTDIDKL